MPSSARSIAATATRSAASGSLRSHGSSSWMICAGRLELAQLAVERVREIHHERVELAVVLVPRLLRDRERSRQRDLRDAIGVAAQELDVADLDRGPAADRADDPRDPDLAAGGVADRRRMLPVDAFERGRERARSSRGGSRRR